MRKVLFILFVSLSVFASSAQNVSQGLQIEQINNLTSLYVEGRFDEIISEAKQLVRKMNNENKAQVYRIVAHAYIMNDQQEEAENAVRELLKYDSNYTIQTDDDVFFRRMIEKYRISTLQISSASLTSESEDELPIPVTIITAEMIKRSGARNIKEVLLTFVPGLSDYEGIWDSNIASRLVATVEQEQMLFLLNGHKMNEKASNKCIPDYSISLEKIESIEVLRGPASAIYGNAAIMNVVNIKTKSGLDLNGAEIALSVGSQSTYKGSFLVGANRGNIDVALWGDVFSSNGEKYKLDNMNTAHIERYRDKPSYDFGGSFKWNGFELLFDLSYGHKAATKSFYYSDKGWGYEYDTIPKYNGNGVGSAHLDYLLGMAYTKKIGNLTLSADGAYTNKDIQIYSANEYSSLTYLSIDNWREEGVDLRFVASYECKNRWGDLLLMGGLNFEYMNVYDCVSVFGFAADSIFFYDKDHVVRPGRENAFSPFLQLKQDFGSHWVLNASLGYDVRFLSGNKLNNLLSPRVSLIYLKDKKFNVKFNYGRAFVNVPYCYRESDRYLSDSLDNNIPEIIDAFQINSNWKFSRKWSFNAVLFYNSLHNIIIANPYDNSVIRYKNDNKMQNIGLETELKYNTKEEDRLMLNFQMTLQRSISFNGEYYDRIQDIPNFMCNLLLGYKVLNKSKHSIWLTTNSRFVGAQELCNQESLSAHILFNAGITYNYRFLEAALNGYNIPNYRYFHGGAVVSPNPQEGRKILGTLRFKF